MFEGLPGNLQQMLEAAQNIQQEIGRVQAEAETRSFEASAGGGMVKATVNGAQKLTALKIERDVVNPDDIEMLQDLVMAAVNEAARNSREQLKEEMSKATGGMPIPGLT